MKEMREGCTNCEGPHPSSECDDKPMGGLEKEASYAQGGYREGGYRVNYYGRSSGNWHDRQLRDKNRNSQPRDDKQTTEKNHEESYFARIYGLSKIIE
ncbi:hypothetical protein Tco_0600282 [Tanacetum coccineum]|uniref:Uncharacterized protein n=1 Tax=Tanacetum coccineum TaxID=301880 RepID=A0ABQ4WBB3_9ASTR